MAVIQPETISGIRDMVFSSDYILVQDVSDRTIPELHITV